MQRITRSGIKFTRNLGKTRTNEGSADPEQNPHKNNKKQNKTIREVIPENPVEEETGNSESESEKSRTSEKSENPVNQQEIENQMKKNRNKSVSPMKTRRLSKGSQLFSLNLRTQKKISKKAKHQKPTESNEEKSETLSDIDNNNAETYENHDNAEIDTIDLNDDHFHSELMPVTFDWIRIDPLIVQIQLPVKNRTQDEGLRTLNFRSSPRTLKISPEYYRSLRVTHRVVPPHFPDIAFGGSEDWRKDYDPESITDRGWSENLRMVLSLNKKYEDRKWSKPTIQERALIVARRLMAAGEDNGQFIPDVKTYLEFKLHFFHRGGKGLEDYNNTSLSL